MSTSFAFKQSLHLCNVSNLRVFGLAATGLSKLAFRARKLSGAFEKQAPDLIEEITHSHVKGEVILPSINAVDISINKYEN